MEGDGNQKKKWNGVDVQKIGVIGVLIYFVQFLSDNVNNDNHRFEKSISELLIKQSSIETKVDYISDRVITIEKKLEDKS